MSSRNLAINGRLFLVGCSRSGTTLLQVLMAGHPRIHSFPETGFFIHAVGVRRRPLAWLGLTTSKARWAIKELLRNTGREDLYEIVPQRPFLLGSVVSSFVHVLDRLTLEEEKDIWLEKTPRHVFYVDYIKRYVDNAHVIHLIRDGRDVVASIRSSSETSL
jgi:hypothetical protein